MTTTPTKSTGSRRKIEGLFDLSDTNLKRRICVAIGSMTGPYEVSVAPKRNTRSNRQNAAWWSMIVEPYYQFLKEQECTIHCRDQAHELLKRELLDLPIVNRQNGEVVGHVSRNTKELDTAEFADLFERAQAYLGQAGIYVPDPDPEWRTAASQPNG